MNIGRDKSMSAARFPLGRCLMTPGAATAFTEANENLFDYLRRHVTGDWGDLDEDDREMNERALQEGLRLMSAYHLSTGVKIWVITEWDRSCTTLLIPSEY